MNPLLYRPMYIALGIGWVIMLLVCIYNECLICVQQRRRKVIPSEVIILILSITPTNAYDYIIIGAGSAGLQMGLFAQKDNASYIIYEKTSTAGSFWTKFPVMEELISVNAPAPGLRYDWHSLLEAPRFNSSNYFPS